MHHQNVVSLLQRAAFSLLAATALLAGTLGPIAARAQTAEATPTTPAAEDAPEPVDESRGKPTLLVGEDLPPDADDGASDDGVKVTYDPQGRRDPFRPLIGQTEQDPMNCDDRLECLLLQDLKVTAILKSAEGSIATLEGGPKRQGYFAREGDRLRNGVVHKIDYESLVVIVREEVKDDRLIKPWRDWTMYLDPRSDQKAPAAKGGRK